MSEDKGKKTVAYLLNELGVYICAPPKAGSSSARHYLFRLAEGEYWSDKYSQDLFSFIPSVGWFPDVAKAQTRIAIHRDPVQRFLSGYHSMFFTKHTDNWDPKKEHAAPDIKKFIDNFDYWMSIDYIQFHFNPQKQTLGIQENYNYIIPLTKSSEFLNRMFSVEFPWAHKTDPADQITPELVSFVKDYYHMDYSAGWNGITYKEKPNES